MVPWPANGRCPVSPGPTAKGHSMSRARVFERIGGDSLRAVLVDFYDRVFADVMIGFLFAGKDQQQLVELEWQFTARLLGADVPYRGRPMRAAHARSPILGGHFERRLQILRNTLADHRVDPEVPGLEDRAARPQHAHRVVQQHAVEEPQADALAGHVEGAHPGPPGSSRGR